MSTGSSNDDIPADTAAPVYEIQVTFIDALKPSDYDRLFAMPNEVVEETQREMVQEVSGGLPD